MNPQDFENRGFFQGKMNLDDAPELIENGQYGAAFNIRPYNPQTGSVGVVTNVEGSEEITYTFTDLGIGTPFLKVIGSRLDLRRGRMYWLVYGRSFFLDERAYVLYYDYATKEVVTVFSFSNVLDFNPDFNINRIDIWYDDAIGDTLLWTDGNSEPKKLNVTASVNRFNRFVSSAANYDVGNIVFANWTPQQDPLPNALLNLPFECVEPTSTPPSYDYSTGQVNAPSNWRQLSIGECYPPFLFKEMFYQKPITPYFSPNAWFTYAEGNSSPSTNLSGKTFQFRYKYVYFDGQESEWSPISEMVGSVELTSGVFDEGGDVVVFNYPTPESIQVRVPISVTRATSATDYTENPHSMVSRVRVVLREVPLIEAPTDWLEFANIPVEDFFKFSVNRLPISTDAPIPGTSGTYYYNWDSVSYNRTSNLSRVVSITVPYTSRETLTPVDVIDTSTNFYPVPNYATSQAIINNKMVWGAVNQGMDISNDIVSKMADTLSFSVTSTESKLSIEQETTDVISWNTDPTSTQVTNPSGNNWTVQWVFDLSSPLSEADLSGLVIYDFNIIFQIFAVAFPFPNQSTFSVSGQSITHSGFQELAEQAVLDALPPAYSVSVNNTTGQMTIELSLVTAFNLDSADGEIVNPDDEVSSFFKRQNLLPERTFKNHTDQQVGFVFQDNAGRLSPVITGSWASLEFPHFINSSLNPVNHALIIGNLADIDVPEDVRIMHILKKRSGSYFRYLQFAISRGNCPEQSWNFRRAFYVGFLNLALDDYSGFSFSQTEPKYLYITPNSMTGEDGGAYSTLFNRRRSNIISPRGGRSGGGRAPGQTSQQGGVFIPQENPPPPLPDTERLLLESEFTNFSPRITPQSGDLVRFLYQMNDDLNVIERFESTFVVKEYNELWNTIVLDFAEIERKEPVLAQYFLDNNLNASEENFVVRIAAEVIRPRETSENEFYWESAAQLSCTNGSVDIFPDRDIIALFGDAFMKIRGQFLNYGFGNSSDRQNFIFVDQDYSDFFESNNVGEGRPSAEVKSIQTRGNYYSSAQRDNVAIHSETTIQETDARNLGTVYDGNIIEVDNVFGRIEYMDAEGDTLHVLQEDKRSRIFSGRSIATELDGAERVLATTTEAFSSVNYMAGVFGISQDGASFAKSGYRRYYADSKRGHVYRESMDGIIPISRVKMERYFKRLFRDYRNSSRKGVLRGFFDETFDEYILAATYWKIADAQIVDASGGNMQVELPADSSYFSAYPNGFMFRVIPDPSTGDDPFTATAQGGQDGRVITFQYSGNNPSISGPIRVEAPFTEVAIFSEKTGGWTTFMSYDTEWGESGIQSYHTFVDGQMHIHEFGNEDWNTFHGRQFPMSVELHSNKLPQQTKFWLTAGVKTNTEEIAMPEITTSESQVSYIPEASFEDREGTKWSEFYGEGEGTDVLEGDRLRGRWLKAKIESDGYDVNEKKVEIFGVVFNSKPSGFTQ